MIKNLSLVQEMQVRSLGWEDPLEKEMATHSSFLALKIPWTEEPVGLQSMGSQSWTCLTDIQVEFISFFFLIFIYYVAVLGLSCGMWDLSCVMGDLSLQHVDSLFAVQGLSSCSTQAELLCGM